MMYSNKLVCSVKSNNKILREQVKDGTSYVFLPFGSEYSLLLKNLGGRNAVVHIQIDGKEVSSNGIYMTAGKEGEITGFINNYEAKRNFKFIQKTQEISDFRGDRIDDGMIRVTWQFEAPKPEKKIIWIEERQSPRWVYCGRCRNWHYDDDACLPRPIWHPAKISWTLTNSSGGGTQSTSCYNANVNNVTAHYSSNIEARGIFKSSEVQPNEGITVDGSRSGQRFNAAYAGELENETHSMVIILKGRTAVIGAGPGPEVKKPLYVRDKKQCPSCGRKYKSKMEFCPKDGTALK